MNKLTDSPHYKIVQKNRINSIVHSFMRIQAILTALASNNRAETNKNDTFFSLNCTYISEYKKIFKLLDGVKGLKADEIFVDLMDSLVEHKFQYYTSLDMFLEGKAL